MFEGAAAAAATWEILLLGDLDLWTIILFLGHVKWNAEEFFALVDLSLGVWPACYCELWVGCSAN